MVQHSRVETLENKNQKALDNNMQSIHSMEYCSVIKRNEGLIYALMLVNFENIMLHEKANHTGPHIMVPFI